MVLEGLICHMAPADPALVQEGNPDYAARIQELEAELAQNKAGSDQVRQRLAELEARTPPPPVPLPPEKPDWFQNPEAATSQAIDSRVAPFAIATLQNSALLARQMAAQDPKLCVVFQKWGAEIDQITQNDGLQYKGNVGYWTNAAKVILANHLEDIRKADREGGDIWLEGGAQGGGIAPAPKPSDVTLTAGEKLWAERTKPDAVDTDVWLGKVLARKKARLESRAA